MMKQVLLLLSTVGLLSGCGHERQPQTTPALTEYRRLIEVVVQNDAGHEVSYSAKVAVAAVLLNQIEELKQYPQHPPAM